MTFRSSIGNDTTRPSIYNVFRQVGVDLNSSPLTSLPIIPLETVQRAAAIWLGGNATLDPFNGAAITVNGADLVNPRSFQSGLGVDTEVAKNLVVGVQLNYVNTVHLLRNRNFNLGAADHLGHRSVVAPQLHRPSAHRRPHAEHHHGVAKAPHAACTAP